MNKKKKHSLITRALYYSQTGCFLVVLISFIILLAYFLQLDFIYRPIDNGASTHPMTALVFLLIAIASSLQKKTRLALLLSILTIILLFLRLQQEFTGSNIIDQVLNYVPYFSISLNAPNAPVMGVNTAIMQFFLSLPLLFSLSFRRSYYSQLLVIFSAFLPLVSLIGYVYQIQNFYGQMSLPTTLLGVLLSLSKIGLSANHGLLKIFLAPHFGARIARVQFIFGVFFGLIGGWLVTGLEQDLHALAVYVIAICFFMLVTSMISAITYERYDKKRRHLERQLMQNAMTDGLTKIYNRMMFDKKINEQFQQQARSTDTYSLLLIDVDHFKRCNDKYGHVVGDKILRTIAQLIKKSVRSTDYVFRYGGEEFAVLLGQCDLAHAQKIAENIRLKVYTQDFTPISRVTLHESISISIGCACLRQGNSAESVVKLADDALYQAKASGRNCVCSADETTLKLSFSSPKAIADIG